jgi:YebC/PmpR family DNA-binding regulatory protein
MAGHSQFKNIMYRKGAQDKKRAKVFTKIIRELTAAAKLGGDPSANPRLRSAITLARTSNMPKDTMERAISRGAGGDDDTVYEEIRYEGYGPGGVAVIVEALTDNRNRTASDVRSTFTKFGGNLGETNSVSFMFERIGLIEYPASVANGEQMFEAALEAGANDVESDDESHEIITDPNNLSDVRDALTAKYGDPQTAKLSWMAKTMCPLDKDQATTMFKLIDVLEDNDDVQVVSTNMELSDEIMAQLDV